MTKRQFLILMVGLPASGKSTAIASLDGEYEIHSSDALIEKRAKAENTTYNAIFSDYIGTATEQFWLELEQALAKGKSVVVDRTNISVKSRRQILSLAPEGCIKIAYVLKTPTPVEWKRRLDSRPGKSIPQHVLDSMEKNFSMPTEAEGFDLVWTD